MKKSILIAFCFLMGSMYAQNSPNTKIRIFDQTTMFDSIVQKRDSLFFYSKDTLMKVSLDTLADNDWYKVGTTKAPQSITDSIYTSGDIRLTDYPNTRSNDTTRHLNSLYTDAIGNVRSARREIIPPSPFIDISATSTGNTFNYYTYYASQLTNIGLNPIPLANLDFYIFAYDPAVFANVSINASGVATFDIISTVNTNSCIDVRFYTK